MEYNNPNNLPIVGEENSHQSLKQEIKEEGRKANSVSECNYAKSSTFRIWWMIGYHNQPTGTPYKDYEDSPSW
jgi:hypothetical protein